MKNSLFAELDVEKFLTLLSQHGILKLACHQSGISPRTIENYRKENPEFNEQINAAIGIYEAMVEAQITAQALSGMSSPPPKPREISEEMKNTIYRIASPRESVPEGVTPIKAFVGMQVVDEGEQWTITGLITEHNVICQYKDGRKDNYISIHGYVPV